MSLLYNSAGYTITAQCRQEPVFERLVKVHTDGKEFVDCPHCGRRYKKNEAGQFFADRPLKVMQTESTLTKEAIEKVLRDNGWKKTVTAPFYIIDYQCRKPFNRIILYPTQIDLVTLTRLTELMDETDLSKHAELTLKWR